MLKSIAGLRNILIHVYAKVDKDKVLEAAGKLQFYAIRIAEKILEKIKGEIDPEGKVAESIVEKLRRVLKGKVKAAFLFGERAKGYVLKGDYDLAVYLRENYNLFDLGELHALVVKELNIPENKLDLVCLNSASPKMVLEALNGIPIVIENPLDVFTLKVKALMELLDVSEGARIFMDHFARRSSGRN